MHGHGTQSVFQWDLQPMLHTMICVMRRSEEN